MFERRSIATLLAGACLASTAAAQRVNQGPGPKIFDREPAPQALDAPITRWEDGFPVGNGTLGAMVWGGDNVLRVSLDRSDLWDERLPGQLTGDNWNYATIQKLVAEGNEAKLHELFDAPYDTVPFPTKLPVGRLELVFPEASKARKFQLELERADVTVGLLPSRARVQVASTRNTIFIRVDNGSPELHLVPPESVKKLDYEVAKVEHEGNETWFVQKAALGLEYAVAMREYREESGTSIAIAIEHNRGGQDALAVARRMTEFPPKYDYEGFSEALHRPRWLQFWKQTSKIKVPDSVFQAHYDFARYLYGSGSRIGAPPIALQGLWTTDDGGLPPWKGDYHNDLNTEMTYVAYPTAALFSEGQALTDFLWQRRARFQEFAKKFYGVDNGAIAPGVMTLDGRATGGWAQYSLSPTNSAWLAFCFYEHWRYTMDQEFLTSRAYPWCADVGRALASLLVPQENGMLRLPLSSSPEIFDNSMRAWLPSNSNYDLALMQWLFGALQEMASASGDKAELEKWTNVRSHLEPLDRDAATGALTFARGIPYAESHRHFSHAMAIHPLGLITIEGSDADRKTIDATIASIEAQGTKNWCGYSFSWFACICARAGKAEKAFDALSKYLSFTSRSGLHVNGDQSGKGLSDMTNRPMTLEGNFLAMQAIQEMLLQSWGGTVRVFPAVVDRWKTISFEGLRTDGGHRVSAKREEGVTTGVWIQARTKGKLRVRDPFPGREAKWTPAPTGRTGDVLEFDLHAEERLEGVAPPPAPTPPTTDK